MKLNSTPFLVVLLLAVTFVPRVGSAQWRNITGTVVSRFPLVEGGRNSLIAAPDGRVFLSVDGAVYASLDSGNTWSSVFPRYLDQSTLLFADGQLMLAHRKNNANDTSFYRTANNGQNWTRSIRPGGGLTSSNAMLYHRDTLFLSLSGSGATQSTVYWSTDMGASWEWMGLNPPMGQNIRDIKVSPTGNLMVSQENVGVHLRNSFGSWQLLPSTGIPLCLGAPCGGVLAAQGQNIYLATRSGLMRFTLGGTSWTRIAGGATDVVSVGNVLIACGTGIGYSTDGGNIWNNANWGLENSTVNPGVQEQPMAELAIGTEYAYALTIRGEVFRRRLSELTGTTSIKPAALEQTVAYPNPSPAGQTLYLPAVKEGRFELLDLTGRVVREGKVSGHSLSTEGLAPGQFVLMVHDPAGRTTRQRLLLQ